MSGTEQRAEAGTAGERWLARALLLPPLVLAWPGPGSLLRADFLPHATGTGAVALATLPAALLVALRRDAPRVRALLFLLIPLLATAAWLAFGDMTDSFEARRALVRSVAGVVLVLGGACLGAAGLTIYARGLAVLAIVLLVVALADSGNGFAGALGNTGSVAMAALPGAAAGAILASRRTRIVGALALLLDLVYIACVPVIAGGVALAAALGAFALFRRGLSSKWRVSYLAMATLAVVGVTLPIVTRRALPADTSRPAASQEGGIEVRARIWPRALAMLSDHPWTGVGPGQFAARFPPYRDPVEIGLSTHGRKLDAETEVEHPHEDWIAPALDLGVVAGIAWILFLLAVARGAWNALRDASPVREELAPAALALLAYAFVHAPLTHEPAALSIAFVVFGAMLAAPGRGPRGIPIAAFVLLVACAPAALAFVRHGRSLADRAAPIEAARAACPDSVLALSLLARLDEERGVDPALVRADWERVLALRPARVEALMQLALADLRAGDAARARATWESALALDPAHPGILGNLRALDLQEGRFEAGRRWLEGADPSPEMCFARAKDERARGATLLADLFEARAHLLWARQHADAGRFADAVRSYRQCVRVTGDHVDGGAPRARLELAAALAAAGREEDARAELAAVHADPGDPDEIGSLPAWAAERLRALGGGR
ncbi:MAG TPA: O-antigen ligase family protein [Planctomycetota bacterium]|jgi:O-antigen ligase|nr:O-antigen ligase family protein [Planctomycetota bacterium]